MKETIDHIGELGRSIDAFAGLLMGNVDNDIAMGMQGLCEAMQEHLPAVIAVYDDPRMAAHAEDKAYWPAQLERILGALEKKDYFLAADALVFEMKANLILLKTELAGL